MTQDITPERKGHPFRWRRRYAHSPAGPRQVRRPVVVIICAGYYFLFVAAYAFLVVPAHFYEGLVVGILPIWGWALMATLGILPAFFLDTRCDRLSSLTAWILYFATVVPCCVVPELIGSYDLKSSLRVSAIVVASLLVLEIARRRPLFPVPSSEGSARIYTVIVPLFVLAVSLAMNYSDNFRISLSLDESLYEHRLEAREIVQEGTISGYLVSTFMGTGLPIIIGEAIFWRSIGLGATALFGVISVMSFNGTKSALFSPVLCGYAIWMVTRRRRGWWFHILIAHVALVLAALGSSVILTLGIYREQSLPAQITSYYFDLADRMPPLLFRDSGVAQWFGISNPLGQDLGRYIGQEYFLSEENNANTNIWASAQAEIPYLGPFVASLVAGTLLRLLDSLVHKKKSRRAATVGAALCAIWALTWSNVALQTSLLSNGVLASLLLVYMIPTQERFEHARTIPSLGGEPNVSVGR